MDLKLLLSTFATVFLAELGDKTQLTTLALASGTPTSKWMVFLGSALALVATSGLAVVAGGAVASVVSPAMLRRLAGVAFVALGLFYLLLPGK